MRGKEMKSRENAKQPTSKDYAEEAERISRRQASLKTGKQRRSPRRRSPCVRQPGGGWVI